MSERLSVKAKREMFQWRAKGHSVKEIAHLYGLRLRDAKRIFRGRDPR